MGTIYINGSEEGGQFRLGEEDRQTQGEEGRALCKGGGNCETCTSISKGMR